ncbi:MAG: cytochrome C [Rhodospirillaceae bacterium]|nr:cytochrome C [Rhodospirillaceae bacterium]MBL6930990.1 cytochrome C [Rhodospirillales bacterium]
MKAKKTSKQGRLMALARLGLAAGALYVAPTFVQLGQASASGALSIATDPLTRKECGECHTPYSPRFLRAYAWQKIMGNLSNHFGEDASLQESTRLKIEKYLVYNASRPRQIGIRISDFKWFKREHSANKISAKAMEKAVSFSNCTACHQVKRQ